MEEQNFNNENSTTVEPTEVPQTGVSAEVQAEPVQQEPSIAPTYEPAPEAVIPPKDEEPVEPKKSKKPQIIGIIVLILIIGAGVGLVFALGGSKKQDDNKTITTKKKTVKSDYKLTGNDFEEFDLQFLRIENKKENVIYSPLSIKYALAMLNEGTEGDSKEQIKALIGDYKSKKYINSKNMSIANAFFIKSSIANSIVEDFKTTLKTKYDAEIITDDFKDPYKLNSWVKDKTLGLINKIIEKFDDEDIFYIVNALAIDMEWQNKFIQPAYIDNGNIQYTGMASYAHTDLSCYAKETVTAGKFEGNKEDVAVMDVVASFNNYDAVKKAGGEAAYKKKVKDYYDQCLKENPIESGEDFTFDVDKEVDEVYKEVTNAYGKEDMTTDFLFYVDDDIKVFAKDLKKYDGTTLQYVGFMPIKEDLQTYLKNTGAETLNGYIKKLKDLKKENFEDGYVTILRGDIPKFKYEYELDLETDLKTLGVKDIFDASKAKLTNITKEKAFIGKALHKANIEFTQYGIKAAAATAMGGAGNLNGPCYYVEKIPKKEIDITFNKPYLYVIRDKDTGEIWFTGQVYNPLAWKLDPDYHYYEN